MSTTSRFKRGGIMLAAGMAITAIGVAAPTSAQAACPSTAAGTTVINRTMDNCNSNDVNIYSVAGHSTTFYGYYGPNNTLSAQSPRTLNVGTPNYAIITNLLVGTPFQTSQLSGGVSYTIRY